MGGDLRFFFREWPFRFRLLLGAVSVSHLLLHIFTRDSLVSAVYFIVC